MVIAEADDDYDDEDDDDDNDDEETQEGKALPRNLFWVTLQLWVRERRALSASGCGQR